MLKTKKVTTKTKAAVNKASKEAVQAAKKTMKKTVLAAPVKKSLTSFKEIGTDFVAGAKTRGNKAFDSPYDFANYVTLGASDALISGAKSRTAKMMDSPADFANYLTLGFTGTAKGALAPKDPFSKEHWLDSFGLATTAVGGAKVVGSTKPAGTASGKGTSKLSGGNANKDTGKAGQKTSGANSKVIEELEGPIIDGKRVGSGKKVDEVKLVWGRDEKGKPFIEKEFPHVSKEHGFSDVVDNYSRFAEKFSLLGGDKIKRELYQVTGGNNGKKGVFEWIVEPNGDVSHRRFIENGVITGRPNQIPKK